MRISTHDSTHNKKHKKTMTMAIMCFVLIITLFLIVAFLCYYANEYILGTILVVISIVLPVIIVILANDISKAYIELQKEQVHIVNYLFGVKKEKNISLNEIKEAKIYISSSFHLKGMQRPNTQYIVFRGENGKYLFKVICNLETKQLFEKYIIAE